MSAKNYQQLKSELNEVLAKLESENLDVDEALILYKKGQKLVIEIENYLKKTRAKIKKINPKTSD